MCEAEREAKEKAAEPGPEIVSGKRPRRTERRLEKRRLQEEVLKRS